MVGDAPRAALCESSRLFYSVAVISPSLTRLLTSLVCFVIYSVRFGRESAAASVYY
jgi:hypothetical protein